MANELFIPSSLDATLATSIADYSKTITDFRKVVRVKSVVINRESPSR